jgi:hypothetical protein
VVAALVLDERLLATTDGLTLTKAFMQIKNAKLRRSIVNLVEDVAGDSAKK